MVHLSLRRAVYHYFILTIREQSNYTYVHIHSYVPILGYILFLLSLHGTCRNAILTEKYLTILYNKWNYFVFTHVMYPYILILYMCRQNIILSLWHMYILDRKYILCMYKIQLIVHACIIHFFNKIYFLIMKWVQWIHLLSNSILNLDCNLSI